MGQIQKTSSWRKILYTGIPDIIIPDGRNSMVSVIIPVYNAEKYLKDCIYSIVNGTFSDYELILVDDGSTDGSGELCDELQLQVMSSPVFKNPPQEFHVLHRENGGVSKARNAAIDSAKGEYIAFVDSDDTVKPDYLEKLYKAALDNDADFVICGFSNGNGESELSDNGIEIISSDEYHERLHSDDFVKYEVAWGKLFSKSIFEAVRFDENHINEDAAIIHILTDKAKKIVFLNEVLYCYYVREASIMTGVASQTGGNINPGKCSDGMRALVKRTEYYLEQKKYRFAFLSYNKFFGKLADYAKLALGDRKNTELAKYYKYYYSVARELYSKVNSKYRFPIGRKMYYKCFFMCPGHVSFVASRRHKRNEK